MNKIYSADDQRQKADGRTNNSEFKGEKDVAIF